MVNFSMVQNSKVNAFFFLKKEPVRIWFTVRIIQIEENWPQNCKKWYSALWIVEYLPTLQGL